MNQHLMAEVNFMAPGEEEGTGGEYECPDSKVIRNVPAWFNNSTFWVNISLV